MRNLIGLIIVVALVAFAGHASADISKYKNKVEIVTGGETKTIVYFDMNDNMIEEVLNSLDSFIADLKMAAQIMKFGMINVVFYQGDSKIGDGMASYTEVLPRSPGIDFMDLRQDNARAKEIEKIIFQHMLAK